MIRKSIGLLVVLAVICASVAIVSAGDSFGPLALTESGLVVSWLPHAAPPVGPLRWTLPKPYGFFHAPVLQATQVGSECTQRGPSAARTVCLGMCSKGDEDEQTT